MSKTFLSSQEFRNLYEKFYSRIRNYLWPVETLKVLAEVEANIYSAFIDYSKLGKDLDRLKTHIKDTMEDDKYLDDSYNKIVKLLEEAEQDGFDPYLSIYQVQEVDPELSKQLINTDKKNKEEDKDENNEEATYQS